MSTALAPVVPLAATRACESTCVPPADVPIFSVTLPLVPLQVFVTSIVPLLRVFVNAQTIACPFVTETLSLAPGVIGEPLSVQASVVV